MTRLILTTSDSGAGSLKGTGIADIVIPFGIPFGFRFVWGRLPSDAELAASLAPNSTQHPWLWNIYRKHLGENGASEHRLIDLCDRCETIELWIDPDPNAQLMLIWLLDYFAPSRDDRIETGFGAGRCRYRQLSAGRTNQMAATGRQDPERSSGNSQRGLAGLSSIDTAGLVQPAVTGFDHPAEASAGCRRTA